MGGRVPKLTDAQAATLLQLRRTLETLPTPDQLANELGLPVLIVRRYLFGRLDRLPKRHEHFLHADHR